MGRRYKSGACHWHTANFERPGISSVDYVKTHDEALFRGVRIEDGSRALMVDCRQGADHRDP